MYYSSWDTILYSVASWLKTLNILQSLLVLWLFSRLANKLIYRLCMPYGYSFCRIVITITALCNSDISRNQLLFVTWLQWVHIGLYLVQNIYLLVIVKILNSSPVCLLIFKKCNTLFVRAPDRQLKKPNDFERISVRLAKKCTDN